MKAFNHKRPFLEMKCSICEMIYKEGTGFVLRVVLADATANICGRCTKNLHELGLIEI